MLKINEKISVIMPAYNEARNIGRVLKVVKECDFIDEVILIDDGSSDKTVEVAQGFRDKRLRIIQHATNQGKGAAMATGIQKAKNDLLLFLDSDLVGLKPEHMLKILSPIVFTGEADLSLGVFGLKKIFRTTPSKVANRIFPSISGQRAIYKKCLPPIERIRKSRYGVDLLITRSVPKTRRVIIALEGLSQIIKENKTTDPVEVIANRIKMYQEVAKTLKEILEDERESRH